LTGVKTQVTPPSLLTKTFEPTAMQRAGVAQATEEIPEMGPGSLSNAQVLPPSLETMMMPWLSAGLESVTIPTTRHNAALWQLAPWKVSNVPEPN
jgi:hypothetical protein